MQPRIEEHDEMTIVGVGGRYICVLSPDHTNMATIPVLWDTFINRIGEIGDKRGDASLGASFPLPAEERTHPDEYYYVAGAEVGAADSVPEGMEARTVPAGTYAIFTHRGLINEIGSTYETIIREWLPTSGYAHAGGPEVELYDNRFRHDSPESEMDIFIPVVRK